MSKQYVVFVDEELMSGSVQMAMGEQASFGDHFAANAGDQLAVRRSILGGLVTEMTGGKVAAPLNAGAASMSANSANSAISALANSAEHLDVPPADDGIRILEGANAIIVNDDIVNIEALEQVVGLSVVLGSVEYKVPRPDFDTATASTPDDWHLTQIGLHAGAPGGAGILIGVLDTGIDPTHPEFAGKTVHFQEFDGAGMKVAGPKRDAGDHGTHVCSIAAGRMRGVAPDADLAVAAVLTKQGPGGMSGTLLQIVNGFDWLVKQAFRDGLRGVDLINASLGARGFNTYLQPAVRGAFNLGIPLIAAIGNAGRGGAGNHSSPGNYPEALGVGASDINDVVAPFSDWASAGPPAGPRYPVPELCAPGVDISAARPGGGFQRMSGTSMATPVVSGVAARRMATNPSLQGRPAALFTDLRRNLASCTPGPLGNLGGAGRIIN